VAKEERRFRAGYYEFVINHTGNDRRAVLAALPTLGALPTRVCVTHASRLAKEERRFPTGYYEFVSNHTDKDRRAVLAAPGYDVLGERQADGASSPRSGHRSAQLGGHIGSLTRKDGPK
jgi:hypothetical protein